MAGEVNLKEYLEKVICANEKIHAHMESMIAALKTKFDAAKWGR